MYLLNLFHLCFVYPPVCSALSLLLSHLVLFSSLSHIHPCLFYLFHSHSLPLCPRVLNWSMETDSLKYLLWNLLHDDNSRPFPCRAGKNSQPELKFESPVWDFPWLFWNVNCWKFRRCHLFTRDVHRNIYEHIILDRIHLWRVQIGVHINYFYRGDRWAVVTQIFFLCHITALPEICSLQDLARMDLSTSGTRLLETLEMTFQADS